MDDSLNTQLLKLLNPAWKRPFTRRLLAWFGKHARDLPWRQTDDLYRIWISEIMLQQTQVATVIAYYQRFVAAFPDLLALAEAEEEQVLRLWEGLGYYRRARQLHVAARHIAREFGGRFPETFAEVLSLPGVGRYTAGAILSIGRDQRLPILEANTIRVLSRLTAYRGDPASGAGQKFLWRAAELALPKKAIGAFNQALMELGGAVCTPKEPSCSLCPLSQLCPTNQLALQAEIPAPKRPKRYEEVREAALVIRRGGKVLLRQCAVGERWAGLWDFPRFAINDHDGQTNALELAAKTHALLGLHVQPGSHLTTIKHGVTRFRITLSVYAAACQRNSRVSSPRRQKESSLAPQWFALAALEELPLSATGRKIACFIQNQPDRQPLGESVSPPRPTNRL